MSIASMTRMAAQAEANRQAQRARVPAPGGAARPADDAAPGNPAIGRTTVTSGSDPVSSAQANLEAIAAFIPSEALALYLAGVGLFQPATTGVKAVLLGLGIGFVILLVAFGATDRQTRPPRKKTTIVMALGAISFTVYVSALPSSPFSELHPQATILASFVGLIMATFLPRIATALGVAPTNT